MRRILLTGLSVLFLGAQAIAATAMTGKELQALLSDGKVIVLGGPKEGYNGELSVLKDGTAHGSVKLDSGDVITIDGVWHITGNKFCRTWKGGTDAGKEVCETWNKTGPKSVTVLNGKENIGKNSWK
ncbi:hypothetical protein HF263_31510 [Rhizobium leguminosarum]|uniref:hypothetical protein n=1 Tax=Rhizobium TaxID=379 RepID=UPI00037DE40F|nr:hypothetical protein [Rhizobium leguminosarum]MBY2994200.1 hypothetical protein [Rhizobium leguminosarum]MBY3034300.1 hypothetical protein [Rhizobium leguminosarum]MBY3060537.1 hypothetical protein [Rhizobium leguminosarum]RWY68794.1 hypothetical protein EHI48_28555 [Rhizobium leguminosarum]